MTTDDTKVNRAEMVRIRSLGVFDAYYHRWTDIQIAAYKRCYRLTCEKLGYTD